MLAFTMIVLFLLGVLSGVLLTVYIAASLAWDDKQAAGQNPRQIERDKLAAEPKHFTPNILKD